MGLAKMPQDISITVIGNTSGTSVSSIFHRRVLQNWDENRASDLLWKLLQGKTASIINFSLSRISNAWHDFYFLSGKEGNSLSYVAAVVNTCFNYASTLI